jgi:hypothetical protein
MSSQGQEPARETRRPLTTRQQQIRLAHRRVLVIRHQIAGLTKTRRRAA